MRRGVGTPPSMAGHLSRATRGNHPGGQDRDAAYRHGNGGTVAPEPLRPLSDAERAVNAAWRWDADLATYVCDAYPEGLA